jgi:hypothetical protein
MKKAKPSKGSARTKRFLDGGAVGALAGLGTLAYLMSRKKKGEAGESSQKFPLTERETETEPSAEVKRAMVTSQGRPDLIPEGADEAAMRSDVGLKRATSTPTPKPKAKPAAKPAEKTVSVGMSGIPVDSEATNRRRLEGLSKAAEPEKKTEKKKPIYDLAAAGRAARDTLSAERAMKRYAETTPYARAKYGMKSGGAVKSSASKRADGIAQRGKTKGRIC